MYLCDKILVLFLIHANLADGNIEEAARALLGALKDSLFKIDGGDRKMLYSEMLCMYMYTMSCM